MDLLRKLFSSQKFIVLLVSAIGLLITKIFKVVVEPATIMEFVILIGGYLIGQGLSGMGKDAAKVNAITALSGTAMMPSEAVEEIKKV